MSVDLAASFETLRDVVVIEFGDDLAGSICGYHLALLGATVFVVEPPEGCWLRRGTGPRSAETGNGILFDLYGRGTHSVFAADVATCLPELARHADVVVEPARARAVPLTGLSERVVSVSFREPDGSRLTELTAQAASGLLGYVGQIDRAPVRVGFELVTYSAAILAVEGILAALEFRAKSGLGQTLRVPFSRVAANILNNVITASVAPEQDSFFSRGWARRPFCGLPASDGAVEFLFYGPRAEQDWRRFLGRLGAEALLEDSRFATNESRLDKSGELAAALAPWTGRLTREALVQLLGEHNAMVCPKHSAGEAVRCEQARANGMVIAAGRRGDQLLPTSPWELGGRRAAPLAAPALGKGRELLSRLLERRAA
jgi:crotonobetainyl-CoA:carnitine CoA-transferase CaiB-like acyl-CoA transferase